MRERLFVPGGWQTGSLALLSVEGFMTNDDSLVEGFTIAHKLTVGMTRALCIQNSYFSCVQRCVSVSNSFGFCHFRIVRSRVSGRLALVLLNLDPKGHMV